MANILMVNDRTYIRDFISKELAHEEYRVVSVGDSKAIWKHIKNSQADLVLLDLYMDNSWQVLHDIKTKDPNLPVLIYVLKSFEDIERIKKSIAEVINQKKNFQINNDLSVYYSY
ncbi:MAG: response regulator [Deltaproteobacteria bacterium]|nr:response regulator [Deltaproteobacteria bacterium]